jgi:hypothetical protein
MGLSQPNELGVDADLGHPLGGERGVLGGGLELELIDEAAQAPDVGAELVDSSAAPGAGTEASQGCFEVGPGIQLLVDVTHTV